MTTLLALSPIVLLAVLLFALRLKLVAAAPITWAFTFVVSLFFWQLSPVLGGSALLKGLFLSFDIVLILFGAIFFLSYLRLTGALARIESLLSSLTPDRRLQAILIAWLFGGFIEGTAGFGTPAAIVAPLLVAIGFPVFTSMLVSLAANSTAVAFGAVGTPVRVGLAGLATDGVAVQTALIHLISGPLVPVLILALVVRGASNGKQAFIGGLPFALFAGLAFVFPCLAISYFGYELPTLLGSALGLLLCGIFLRLKILIPKDVFRFSGDSMPPDKEGFSVWPLAPYLLLLFVLLMGKLLFTARMELVFPGDVMHAVGFFNPGFAFFTTAMILLSFRKGNPALFLQAAKEAAKPLIKTAAAIFFITSFTQTMILSGAGERAGMLEVTAMAFEPAFPWASVFIGAFGSFLAGSATVSNLIFAPMQAELAMQGGFTLSWILALQLAGAAAGNMIALPNILAVKAAVGSAESEIRVLKMLLLPCLVYIALATGAGLLLMRVIS